MVEKERDDPSTTPADDEEFGAIIKAYGDCVNEERFDEAATQVFKAFVWALEHPPEETPADKLDAEADEAIERGDWEAAEELYRQKLAIDSEDYQAARTHMRLGRLCQFLGRHDEAFEHGRRGNALATENGLDVFHAMVARQFADLAGPAEHSPEVEASLRECLAELPVEPVYAQIRASVLGEIAAQRRLAGEREEAGALLDEALAMMEGGGALRAMPGSQHTLCRLWHVRALLCGDRGEKRAAAAAWKQAVPASRASVCFFQEETPLEVDARSRFLAEAAGGLRAAGRRWLARRVRRECNSLRAGRKLPPLAES
ncbi:MAG: hypothetical protein DWQ37_21955 [Planctomycetota bacterium]|nr:MAG: hypothetical protein DWQ37_21955 [Planctomycetota bacterium]